MGFPLGRLNLSNINTALTKSVEIDPFYGCLRLQAHHVSAEGQRWGWGTACAGVPPPTPGLQVWPTVPKGAGGLGGGDVHSTGT